MHPPARQGAPAFAVDGLCVLRVNVGAAGRCLAFASVAVGIRNVSGPRTSRRYEKHRVRVGSRGGHRCGVAGGRLRRVHPAETPKQLWLDRCIALLLPLIAASGRPRTAGLGGDPAEHRHPGVPQCLIDHVRPARLSEHRAVRQFKGSAAVRLPPRGRPDADEAAADACRGSTRRGRVRGVQQEFLRDARVALRRWWRGDAAGQQPAACLRSTALPDPGLLPCGRSRPCRRRLAGRTDQKGRHGHVLSASAAAASMSQF